MTQVNTAMKLVVGDMFVLNHDECWIKLVKADGSGEFFLAGDDRSLAWRTDHSFSKLDIHDFRLIVDIVVRTHGLVVGKPKFGDKLPSGAQLFTAVVESG